MSFKSIVREMRESIGRRGAERRHSQRCGRSHIAPVEFPSSSALAQQSQWANLPPELLVDVIHRVEASQTSWPARKDVVACASVCRSWRSITKEVVRTPEQCGLLTFPISVKQPGPRDSPLQCFIKRERASSTYRLYFRLSPALSGDFSKLMLAARKIRKATSTEFVISLVADQFSRTSKTYIGKLRSNFLGTKFIMYDSHPPCNPASQSLRVSHQRSHLKEASPRGSVGSYNVATICYELNVLRTRGPRRMQCNVHAIPMSSMEEGGTAPTPTEFTKCLPSPMEISKSRNPSAKNVEFSTCIEPQKTNSGSRGPLVLKNKAPRWHEQLQCWCLNFKGRVTVASVKNFQLVAAVESCQTVPLAEQEKVILQFGKIGKDIFTMDYRYPLSAFQAFAICLSSFDTKPACE